jgi:hypothetical protein
MYLTFKLESILSDWILRLDTTIQSMKLSCTVHQNTESEQYRPDLALVHRYP